MAGNYFQSYHNYFWQWEDHGEILAIPGGSTIAYRPAVLDIMNMLAHQGLPRFGSLVLVIAATNPRGEHAIAQIEDWAAKLGNESNTMILSAFSFLHVLAELPSVYKQEGNRKIRLFQTIFKQAHNLTNKKDSQNIIADAKNQILLGLQEQTNVSHSYYANDFKILELLGRRFHTTTDIIEAINRLFSIEEELLFEEEFDQNEKPTDFIDDLIREPRTQKVGALVRQIWSGLNIPFHTTIPSQMPIGGVADLTNKGNFDQLLISEFANDDLVFLSRLANNEALYLNRESPPSNSATTRVVLIDTSLKTWGTPKMIAFATMVAIVKHPKNTMACEAYVIGTDFRKIEIDSVLGISDALQKVTPTLDVSEGLAAYLTENPSAKNRELFLLTQRENFMQSAIQRVLEDFSDPINYWVLNDSTGHIDIYKNQQKRKKFIQHLELPLDQLLRKKRIKIEPNRNGMEENYPILVRSPQDKIEFRETDDKIVFQMTKDKYLLRFAGKDYRSKEKGWEIISENLPFYWPFFEIGFTKEGTYIYLTYNSQQKEVVLVNLSTKEQKVVPFKQWKQLEGIQFILKGHKFYHVNSTGAWSVNLMGEVETCEQQKTELSVDFDKANQHAKEVFKKLSKTVGALKNVENAGLNTDLQLTFNRHVFFLNSNKQFTLRHRASAYKITAIKQNEDEFIFEDGSRIEICKAGLIILKSSDETIPTIYIPSVLTGSLGLATKSEFTGNRFYLKEKGYRVKFIEPGTQKLPLIKSLRTHQNIGLQEAHEILNSGNQILTGIYSQEDAQEIKKEFEELGAKVELIASNPDHQPLTILDPISFNNQYIKPFISRIIQHGT